MGRTQRKSPRDKVPTTSPVSASLRHSPVSGSRASGPHSSASSSTQEMRAGLVPRKPGREECKAHAAGEAAAQGRDFLGPPTPRAGPRGWAGWTGLWAQASRWSLTERAQVAVGLSHHVPVQGPLRGPQTPPLLRGEVHGHVREAQGLGFSPLAPGPVSFPRGERGRGRRHRKCHPGGGPAPPLPAGVRGASAIKNAPWPGPRVGAPS